MVSSLKSDQLDHKIFDEMYDKYRSDVYSFACYLTQNKGEAEDLFQETWLRVVRNFPKMPDMKKIKAWLFTITSNLYKDSMRKKRVRKLFFLQKIKDFDQKQVRYMNTSENSNLDKAENSEQMDIGLAISDAIANIPDRYRLIFVLKEIAGFKQSEISEILGIPVGTVKSLMHRAVNKLRRELADYRTDTNGLRGVSL